MKRYRTCGLPALMIVLLWSCAAWAGEGIRVVTAQDGRKIFVNDSPLLSLSSPSSTGHRATISNAAPRNKYIYWSNTAHRWKPVPGIGASPNVMRAARSAAAEVLAETQPPAAENNAATPMNSTAATADASAGNTYISSTRVNTAIELAAARHNVDPDLVRAVIKVESDFNPQAVSRKGAMGLMQLMPGTARQLHVAHPFDPNENVDAGVRQLKQLLESYNGDLRLSLAAYNAGERAVQSHNGVPPYAETRNYVRQITSLYHNGWTLLGGPTHMPIHVSHDAEGHLLFSNTE
jgi:soluble lytic murein transglycosylase-like protein